MKRAEIDKWSKTKQVGKFTLASGKDIYGELELAGSKTSLYLQDKNFFDSDNLNHCVRGTLNDFTKVTLFKCIPRFGSVSQEDQKYYFSKIFPHYVFYGDKHIDAVEKQITAVHLLLDDAPMLFYDTSAFRMLLDARPFIEEIVRADGYKNENATGPNPQILYFSGKHEIFKADTVFGEITAAHHPTATLAGPEGVRLDNKIYVTLDFKDVVTFEETVVRVRILLRYFALMVGRPQNLLEMSISIEPDKDKSLPLHVYWSYPPKRRTFHGGENPGPADVLLNPVEHANIFSCVLNNWLKREEYWNDARQRFNNSFSKGQVYSIDRLIGAANMFDILPDSAVPPDIQVSEELQRAKEQCRTVFRALPKSPERDSVLSALGRVGKSNLKHKIRYRCRYILKRVGDQYPNLLDVTDAAVNCRNHYVHGNVQSFDYRCNIEMESFFTDTLEFVFGISDLIESGWDVETWSKSNATSSHPFSQYSVNYSKNLEKLQSFLGPFGKSV